MHACSTPLHIFIYPGLACGQLGSVLQLASGRRRQLLSCPQGASEQPGLLLAVQRGVRHALASLSGRICGGFWCRRGGMT